jgi:hypothetical protein
MRKLLFVLLIFTLGCNSEQADQTATSPHDMSTQSNPAAIDSSAKATLKPLIDRNEIIGVWESDNKEPLTVEINRDSIYYTEHFESHRYKLKGDSIFINYTDFVFAAKVYFKGDTLVMESEDGQSKFVKFKQ